MAGYDDPSPGGSAGWTNPCPDPAPPPPEPEPDENGDIPPQPEPEDVFSEYFYTQLNLAMDEDRNYSVTQDGDPITYQVEQRTGGPIDGMYTITSTINHDFVIEWVKYRAGCRVPGSARWDPALTNEFWVRRPTTEGLVGDLLADVFSRLQAPYHQWPDMNDEFGWMYVNVDNDVRINPIADITESETASNILGTVSASVTASPSYITVTTDEPEPGGTTCTYEEATAPYNPEQATFCTYKFTWSSGVAPDNVFRVQTTLYWDVTTTGDITVSNPISSVTESVAVAEFQAVVTNGG